MAWPSSSPSAKNTSVAGMVEAGILESKRGKVRLLLPAGTARRLGSDQRHATLLLGRSSIS